MKVILKLLTKIMKYLKKFLNKDAYVQNLPQLENPSVSYLEIEKEVHYTLQNLTIIAEIETPGVQNILGTDETLPLLDIVINGVSVGVHDTYNFSASGNYVIEYIIDPQADQTDWDNKTDGLLRNISFPFTAIVPNDQSCMYWCFKGSNIRNITFYKGVTEIYAGICQDCTELGSVILPETVQYIDDLAFVDSGAKEITILATQPPYLGREDNTSPFSSNMTIYVPEDSVQAYKTSWGNSFPSLVNQIQPIVD